MKKYLLLTLLSLLGINSFAQLVWSEPVDLATLEFGNSRPVIKLINDTTPVVIWTKGPAKELYFSKMNNGVFDYPIQIARPGIDVLNYTWAGPELETYNDDIFVTLRTNPWSSGVTYLIKSTDGGLLWNDTVRIDKFKSGMVANFPMLSAINENDLTVTYMHHNGFDVDPQYARVISTDGGDTWSDTVDISRQFGAEVCDCCSPLITSKNNDQIIIFRNNDQNVREFKAMLSVDGGVTFTKEITVDTSGWVVNACPSSATDAVLFDTYVVTTYMSNGVVYLVKSDLTSGTMDMISPITLNTGSKNYPKMAANTDSVIVVWEGVGNKTDLFYNIMSSDLSGFDAANTFPVISLQGYQTKPSVAMEADGTIHVVYMDSESNTVKYINNRPNDANGISSEFFETLAISPNPVANFINLNLDVDSYMIYDALGKEQSTTKKGNVINVTSFEPGNYLMLLTNSDNKRYVSKFVKQ